MADNGHTHIRTHARARATQILFHYIEIRETPNPNMIRHVLGCCLINYVFRDMTIKIYTANYKAPHPKLS